MEFDQLFFEGYLQELQNHLFPNEAIEDIIAKIDNHHQARRFVAMYLLKDKDSFHEYYSKREQLEIGHICDTLISGLFHQREKKPIKQQLIDLIGISESMADFRIEGYPIVEFDKDLNSFIVYWRKHSGTLLEMLEKLYPHCFVREASQTLSD